jgi:serine/threonine protein kinase
MNFQKRLMSDGLQVAMLVGPDGGEVKDLRRAFFSLPPWAQDPFGTPDEEDGSCVIGESFEVTAMIFASNRGCVYEAVDLHSGDTVIVKEARPHVHRTTRGGATIDSQLLLEHEFDVLKHLEGLPCTVQPIRLFKDWEHLFLVEDKVPGVMLRTAAGRPENLWLPYAHGSRMFGDILSRFHRMATSLIDAVEAIHARGVILSDLSVNNVMVDADSWSVTLIDFEAAIRLGLDEHLMPVLSRWITPGFIRKERLASGVVDFIDDHYAASRVLLHTLVPTGALTDLNPGCHTAFVDYLLEVGVPEWVADLIETTSVGDLLSARDALARAGVVSTA